MSRYALLVAPASNRVYAGEAHRLAEAELACFGETVLSAGLRGLTQLRLGGIRYVGFETGAPLGEADLGYLSNLSSAYALFQVVGVGGSGEAAAEGRSELLRPLTLTPLARYDDDLLSIPKYYGKTNEQFTQLLLNVTVLASAWAKELRERRLVVLDPLCGRGTTLNQALRYGYDALGIESDGSHVDGYATFLRTWLRRKRIKHTVELHPVRHDGKRVARRLTAELAPSKEEYRAGDLQRLTVLHADTVEARRLLKPGSCHVIVTDAPYGVAHRSKRPVRGRSAPEGRVGAGLGVARPSRHPQELLAAALPGWAELLRGGGALGVSFNTHVAGRDEVAKLLEEAGLHVVTSPAYAGFTHWVDQGITRDLLVARKPA